MLKNSSQLRTASANEVEFKETQPTQYENLDGDTITLTKDQLAVLLNALKIGGDATADHLFKDVRKNGGSLSSSETKNKDITSSTTKSDVDNSKKLAKVAPARLEQAKNNQRNHEEKFEEWNPWGKPGGGAPLKRQCKSTGDLIHCRGQSPSWSHTDGNGCRFGTPATAVARVLPQIQSKSPSIKYIPMAIASTVPLGSNEDAVSLELYKQEEKKRWLAELEKQRDEQRKRKEMEKQRRLGYESPSFMDGASRYSPLDNLKKPISNENILLNLTDSDQTLSSHSSPSLQSQPSPTLQAINENMLSSDENLVQNKFYQDPVFTSDSPLANMDLERVSVMGNIVEEKIRANDSNEDRPSFLRGHNVPLDPNTKSELAEKRLRALKYQQDIQAQIDEKARLKQQEKMRLQKEEELAEARFLQQQQLLQEQFNIEQQKMKEKKLAEEEKHRKVAEEMQKAKTEAEAEKHSRKKSRIPLESGVITPDLHNPPVAQFHEQSAVISDSGAKCPEEISKPSPTNSSSGIHHNQMSSQTEEIYITNRLLTPTVYRNAVSNDSSRASSREFGTQTDATVDNGTKNSKQTSANARIPRKFSGSTSSAKSNDNTRPKWGVNKPQTTYLKQSEKDPHYEKRRNYARERRRTKQSTTVDSDSTTSFEDRLTSRTSVPVLPRLPSKHHNFKNSFLNNSFPSLNQSWPNHTNPHQKSELGKTRRRWHSHESFTSLHRNSIKSNLYPPFSPPSHASPHDSHSCASFCPCAQQPSIYHNTSPLRKKWSDQKKCSFGAKLSNKCRRNSKEDCGDSKAHSADSGYADEAISNKRGPEANGIDHQQVTSPIIRSTTKGSPFPRQDKILQQLSDLRQGLLQKQMELQKLINASKSSGI